MIRFLPPQPVQFRFFYLCLYFCILEHLTAFLKIHHLTLDTLRKAQGKLFERVPILRLQENPFQIHPLIQKAFHLYENLTQSTFKLWLVLTFYHFDGSIFVNLRHKKIIIYPTNFWYHDTLPLLA